MELDSQVAGISREYAFRRRFSVTHEQFLDEPTMNVDWLLNMDRIYQEVESGK